MRLCILVYMVHETNFMNPILAMTRGLDVQLWVGLMGNLFLRMLSLFWCHGLSDVSSLEKPWRVRLSRLVSDLLWGQRDFVQGFCSSGTLELFVQNLHGWSFPLAPRWGPRLPLSNPHSK